MNEYVLPKVDCLFFNEEANPRFCMVLREAYCFKEKCRFYKPKEDREGGENG